MTTSILAGHMVRLRGRDKWPPYDVLEFSKRRAEITGGKGRPRVMFSSVSVGELCSKVKAKKVEEVAEEEEGGGRGGQ